MRYLSIILFTLSLNLKAAAIANSPLLWQLFKNSKDNTKAANELYNISKNFTNEDAALLIGYKGISSLLMCNHLNNPFDKLSYFKTGKKWLEEAIKKDSSSLELRFFRYSVQCKAPDFLNYKNNLNRDKTFLITQLSQKTNTELEKDIFHTVLKFLLANANLNADERKLLLNLS